MIEPTQEKTKRVLADVATVNSRRARMHDGDEDASSDTLWNAIDKLSTVLGPEDEKEPALVWQDLRTPETKDIENNLKPRFGQVDCYQYNPSVLRLRIIDPTFGPLTNAQRQRRVNAALACFSDVTLAKLISVFLLPPGQASNFEDTAGASPMTYRVDCNESGDDNAPDWRTEFRGTLTQCERKARELRKSKCYSEVQVNVDGGVSL